MKHKWRLLADEPELKALRDALARCPAEVPAAAPPAAVDPGAPVTGMELYR